MTMPRRGSPSPYPLPHRGEGMEEFASAKYAAIIAARSTKDVCSRWSYPPSAASPFWRFETVRTNNAGPGAVPMAA